MQASGIWGLSLGRWGRTPDARRCRLVLGSLAVAALALATYAKVPRFGFIYDDYWTVVANPWLDRPFGELAPAMLSGRTVEWNMPDATRPLMSASLWLDRRFFALSPAGYHLHSALLYALACVLAFWLALGVLRRFVAAWLAGAAFAVSPLHVEVASAVNYREDLLAAIGWLGAAALCFWPWRRAWTWQSYACAALWAWALLSKESALVAPAFIAALALGRRPAALRARATPLIAITCAGVAALWLNWRFGMSRLGEQIPTASYASWTERCLRAARFEVISLWKSFVPIAPRPEHAPLGPAHWAWTLALLGALLAIAALWRTRRTRVLAAAALAALVAPLGTSPLAAPLNELADRYWFVGSFAAALTVGWLAARIPGRSRWALVVLLGAACSASWKASSVWSSEVDLWTFAVQTAPSSARAWTALSRVHRLADQRELAARALGRALALRPGYVPARTARVLDALWFGDLAAARQALAALDADDRVHGDSLRAARRCAAEPDAVRARACARRTVPRGLVLGDPERLRAISERLLGPAPEAAEAPAAPAAQRDAGGDAGSAGGQ